MIYKLQNAGKIAKTVIKATKRAPVSSLDKIPIWKRIFPIMRTVQDDLTEMNKYHQLNVDEYNKTFGTNIQSIPFRTEFPINAVKILPRNEFEALIDVNNMNSPNKNIENIGGYYSRKGDQVVLPNTAKSSAAYHEFEHMGKYGLTNPEITRWRIEQLVDPEKTVNMTDNAKTYFLSEEEFPVHLRQYGENLGIGIGDPYPGDIEFDKLLEENGIGGASTFVKRTTSEEKRLMWMAMNGTLFASLPFVSTLFGIQKDKNGGVIKLQKAWTKIPRILRKAIKGFGETVDKTTFVPAQVKYYGPTMGKTTSIRTNPNLVDFDAIMRDPSKALLKKYGFSSKYQMFESGNQDAIKEYQDLLVQKMNEFKSNPNNSGKVLIVSQSPVVNPEDTGFQFDNEPSIPSKEVFVSRNVGRGGTTFDSEDWWTNLMQRNPNLKINNRFVSDIEGNKELIHVPKITIPDVRTYHLVDSSIPLSRPISEAEKLGLPKSQRNQPIKQSDNNSRELQRFLKEKSNIEQKSTLGYTLEEIERLPEEYQAVAFRGRSNFAKEMSDKMRNYFADPDKVKDFNKLLKDYVSQIESDIDPRIISTFKDGIEQPSIVVRGFRNYLRNAGVDASELSNEELAKILTQQYKTLSTEATGKLKDDILWHGSPEWFDSFDFSHTGENTGNGGALGPGNYFSLVAGQYGRTKSSIDYRMKLNNTQPYIITGIQSTPNGATMIEKGALPEYIGPVELKTESGRAKLNDIIKSIPKNDNRAYIDLSEMAAGSGADYSGPSAGVMVRRNTGIKSLYPHPSRFIRNSDGTVSLIPTNWSDVRVNFKQGGILKAQRGTGLAGLPSIKIPENIKQKLFDWLKYKEVIKYDANKPVAYTGLDGLPSGFKSNTSGELRIPRQINSERRDWRPKVLDFAVTKGQNGNYTKFIENGGKTA